MKTILLLMAASLCFGQTDEKAPPQQKFYRFDFAVKEVDGGKVVGTKNYSSMGKGSIMIRSGDKMPMTNRSATGREVTFLDVGTNIDCQVLSETATQLALRVSVDISNPGDTNPPVVSQTKWNSNIIVPLRKPTVVFSSEGTTRKIQTQLEITVTPLE